MNISSSSEVSIEKIYSAIKDDKNIDSNLQGSQLST